MSISHLSLTNFRNIVQSTLDDCAAVNFIYGENGSGKTSVLEAISLLGMGRSFRTHKHKTLINSDQQQLAVFLRSAEACGASRSMGVSRHCNGEVHFRLDGEKVKSAVDLASQLPLQVINAHSFDLLEGGPQSRRQFMDWLVFHVEPGFYGLWKAAQRCLKHRNSLLRRDRIERLEVAPWDAELALVSARIDELRRASQGLFQAQFEMLVDDFIAVSDLSIGYYRGWDAEQDYSDYLNNHFERDAELGYTRAGIHRADLRIKVGKQLAADILSRGQQKLLVCAMKIAQGLVHQQVTGRRCVYLVDDLPAELDRSHRRLIARWLAKIDSQVFVTGVEREVLQSAWDDFPGLDKQVFHVKHGCVTRAD